MERTKIFIISAGTLLALLVIIVVVVSGMRRQAPTSSISQPAAALVADVSSSTPTVPAGTLTPTESQTLEHNINAVYQTDKDFDGLSDTDEVNRYHTNPASSDSDNDGILDGDEINIYKTNPLVADTDGDTFLDGYEVSRGYNPLGPGKLKR